jgi:hypothetical protein
MRPLNGRLDVASGHDSIANCTFTMIDRLAQAPNYSHAGINLSISESASHAVMRLAAFGGTNGLDPVCKQAGQCRHSGESCGEDAIPGGSAPSLDLPLSVIGRVTSGKIDDTETPPPDLPIPPGYNSNEIAIATIWLAFFALAVGAPLVTSGLSRAIEIAALW